MTLEQDGEQTPLLDASKQHEVVYQRFSRPRKRMILSIASLTGLLPLFVAGSFVPSIPQVAKDLNTTGAVIGLAVSLSVLATAVGALFGATYSSFYGRRPVYLAATPLLFIGSVGVATAQNVPQLLIGRFIQTFGASPGFSVGAGVIGDIYKLEERGAAMGTYFAAILLGPALAPLAGGLAAHYASWRVMQLSLGGVGLLTFFWILFAFPETYHPGKRGVDMLPPDTRPPLLLNPLSPLKLLKSPNLLAVTWAGFVILLTDYVLLIPLAYTIGKTYGITNEAVIGACFIPVGLGNMIGAPLAGRLSDKVVAHYRKARGGEWYPEDRLRITTIIGALFLAPLSVFLSGILTTYVPGRIGLIANLLCLFMNGIGVDFVLSPSGSYVVDLMHSRSAEAMAASTGTRSIPMAIAIACILPMIERYGLVVTNSVTALFALTGLVCLLGTIKYGARLRAAVDVGYSTAENN